MTKAESFVKRHQISLNLLAQKMGLTSSQLKKQLNTDANNWSSQFLKRLSQVLNMKPGQIINELKPRYELEISNHSHSIQGIAIHDAELFEQVRFVVEAEHLEGWEPSSHDIQLLIELALAPDNDFNLEIDRIWGELND